MSNTYIPQAIFSHAESLARQNSQPKCLPDEYVFVRLFLLSYSQSPDTYNTYRREIERYCQWVWFVEKTVVSSVSRHDIMKYIKFFQSPPASWIASQHKPRMVDGQSSESANPEWRPFVVRPGQKRVASQAGMKSMLACLSTFYTFLIHEGQITLNPIQMLNQKKQLLQTNQTQRVKRRLSQNQWYYVVNLAQKLADDNLIYERHLYLLSLFFLLGLRISEVSQTGGYKPMSLFYKDAKDRWWFEAHGKGNKVRDVAVPDAMLEGLRRYRTSIGLDPLPSATDTSPLVPKHKGLGGLSSRQVRVQISEIFELTYQAMLSDGMAEEAQSLKQATVHWLRHTAISEDVQNRPSEHVRDDVGHENIATTSLYIDVLDDSRHASAKDKKLK